MPAKQPVRPDKSEAAGSGRKLQSGQPAPGSPGRGSSVQGERQDAKGGPQGANQGGAPRGSSRLEPSHARRNPAHITGKKKASPSER